MININAQLLAECAQRKGALFVYLWLCQYGVQVSKTWVSAPSLAELAASCRMKDDHVRAALRWLEAEGWISRRDRPGDTTAFVIHQSKAKP